MDPDTVTIDPAARPTFDPAPRRTRELIPERGRRLETGGLVRMHRGLWIPRSADLTDPIQRIAGITALYPDAVATGWLAAHTHGHPFPPREYPDEFATATSRTRRPGMIGRRYAIPPPHVWQVTVGADTVGRVASPAWALFDIARRGSLADAVVALDAASSVRVDPQRDIRPLAETPARLPGKRQVLAALDLCDTRAESPGETRTRLFLCEHGLTGFEPQVWVPGLRYRLDLARRDIKVAVEYDGAHHREPRQHERDLTRWNELRRDGWLVFPLTLRMIGRFAERTAADIRDGVRSRGG